MDLGLHLLDAGPHKLFFDHDYVLLSGAPTFDHTDATCGEQKEDHTCPARIPNPSEKNWYPWWLVPAVSGI
jgi:hypothetical protein